MSLWEYLWAGSAITRWLYRLNGNANDSSWNGNNGTASNVSWVDWLFWQCWSFDWTSSDIVVNSNLWITTWSITMSLWVKMNVEITSGSSLQFFCVHTQTTQRVWYYIAYRFANNNRFIDVNRVRLWVLDQMVSLNIALWTVNYYNIILRYDWTNIAWFLNWNIFGQTAASWTWSSAPWNNLHIWRRYNWGLYANACIDEVIVENRARTAVEVQKYYTYAKGRFGIL